MTTEHSALVRLTLSRERLRQALGDASTPRHESVKQPASQSTDACSDTPSTGSVAHLLIEAVRGVWSLPPLHDAVDAAAGAARSALRPTAQRHPAGLVVGALLMGGLLVWSRPWRWMLRPVLAAAWMPQLLLWAVTQRPIRSWTSLLTALAQPRRAATTRPAPTQQ
jgi:hypothetical protein